MFGEITITPKSTDTLERVTEVDVVRFTIENNLLTFEVGPSRRKVFVDKNVKFSCVRKRQLNE